jgi:hypothetical protein
MEIRPGGIMVTDYLHLLLGFGKSGVIRLLPLHVFIARTEPTLPLRYIYIYIYMGRD